MGMPGSGHVASNLFGMVTFVFSLAFFVLLCIKIHSMLIPSSGCDLAIGKITLEH
jgi:hypothetical protein